MNLVLWFSKAGSNGLNDQEFFSGFSKKIDKKSKIISRRSLADYNFVVDSKSIGYAIDRAINSEK